MSVPGKTVYRVEQIVAHNVAIITEVKDGEVHSGKVRETRDSRIILGGKDSFWLVGGEKKDQKLVVQKDYASLPTPTTSILPMAARIQASTVFDLPKIVSGNLGTGNLEAVSFSTATRLSIGYSPRQGSSEELLAALSKGTLDIPIETVVSAIELRPGQWLTSSFNALPSGHYGLKQPSLRAVAISTLENRPDTIKLAQGLVVFVTQPKWSEPKKTDLRPEHEIFQSVERWLSRSKAALRLPDGAGILTPTELLRLLSDRAVSEEEKADLAAIAGHLSKRAELADILPEILARDPAFRDKLTGFEESEKARLRAELEGRLRRETQVESSRLAALQSEIADAEAKLATLSHREALLRSETEKHEETLRGRIASAAEAVRTESSRETALIRDEVARLRDDVAQIAAAPVALTAGAMKRSEEMVPETPPVLASNEQRQKTVRELAAATGLKLPEVAAIVAMATVIVPVLVGADASAAAVDIATALAGDEAAVVFCDPTKVSLADLLNDEHSGLKTAIERANERPQTLAAAALCGITSGPCEYWLPQIVELRRVGRLPSNLALVASAGVDGIRVSIPDSTLRYLFPLTPSNASRPGSVEFEGLWAAPSAPEQDRLGEAVDILIERGLEGTALQNTAKVLARTLSWVKIPDLVDVFLRQAEWLAAVAAGDDHQDKKFFKDIG